MMLVRVVRSLGATLVACAILVVPFFLATAILRRLAPAWWITGDRQPLLIVILLIATPIWYAAYKVVHRLSRR